MAKSSEEYWADRERENLEKNLKTEAEYFKEIEDIYRYTMAQIQKEIDSFYAKYASKEGISIAEAKKRVSKLDMEEFSRKAKKYVEEKNFSKQANEEMRLYNLTMKVNRLELLKAQIGLELVTGFDELQQFFDEKLNERTMEEFQRQAGILGYTILDNEKMAKDIVNASFKNATFSERIWTHQELLRAELEKLLKTGLIQGRNPRELARQLRKVFDASIFNSERLLRTELARVQTEAQKQSYIRNGFDQYTYITCGDGKVCSECKPRNGKHYDVENMMPGENAPPMHPTCVLPDTKIIAPDIEAITRSQYSGDVIEIGTSNGARLTVTPNHIVLTARGWVRAKNLIKGDKVINYSGGIKSVIESDPTDNDGVSTIEEFFTSLLESGLMTSFSVPVTSKDFKGDIVPDSEVDVVLINSELRDKLNLSLVELVGDVLFVGAAKGSKSVLPCNCSLAEFLVGAGLAADGIMSGSRIAEILFTGTLTHRQLVSLRLPSDYDTRLYETEANDTSADIKLLSNGIFAHSGSIHISNLLNIKRNFDPLERNAASLEATLDGRFCDSVGLCDFISAFSGFVTFDDIIFVTNKYYSGHVYDASSLSTLYIANGIITSNCRCSTAAYMDDKSYNEWLDGYKDHGLSFADWKKKNVLEDERGALNEYISSGGYKINEKLRKKMKLGADDKEFISNLDSALSKMSTYSGNLVRTLDFSSEKERDKFIADYQIGRTIRHKEYFSTSKKADYNPDANVIIYVQDGKKGKDISAYNPFEHEVLYDRNFEFKVINIGKHGKKCYILLEEKR